VPRPLFIATSFTNFCELCKVRYVAGAPPFPFPTITSERSPASYYERKSERLNGDVLFDHFQIGEPEEF
jgi:hypothetical protein